jgi:site-specific recombinase XerD
MQYNSALQIGKRVYGGGKKPKLLDSVRAVARVRHLSLRTEEAYVARIRQFILFHNKRHPLEMGADEIATYLTHLAVNDHVAASTQNVALSALLFLYRDVLHVEMEHIQGVAGHRKNPSCP